MKQNDKSLVPFSQGNGINLPEEEFKVNFNKMSAKKRMAVSILASNGFDIVDASERLKKTQKTIQNWWNRDQNFRNGIIKTHMDILGIDKQKRLNIHKFAYRKLTNELIDRVSDNTQLKLLEFGEVLKGLQYLDKVYRLDTIGEVTEKIATKDINSEINERFSKRTEDDKKLINLIACKDEDGNLEFVEEDKVGKNGLTRV